MLDAAADSITLKLKIAYGRDGLPIEVPDENLYRVLETSFVPGLEAPFESILDSLQNPIGSKALRELAGSSANVVIVVSDKTRPVPSGLLLPPIIDELNRAGVDRSDITILVATGLHRPNTREELVEMLGREVVDTISIINHDARDRESLVHLGKTKSGTPIWLNRVLYESDFRILTGYIEPHFFAGYTGGRKAILPGCAGQDTIGHNHGASHIGHPKARYGVTDGNPIYEDAVEVAEKVGVDFIVNVTLNRNKEITRVFSGHVFQAHNEGVKFISEKCRVNIPEEVDIAITNNSGYPLDLNLYQAVKGMTTPENVIRQGGEIIMAAECSEGIGHHTFEDMILEAGTPENFLKQVHSPGFFVVDQWQVQVLARILSKARISLYSENLDDEQVRRMWLNPLESVEEGIQQGLDRLGEDSKILVLPDGPETWVELA
jgi:nickel-dependent lactate racemase